MKAKLIFVVLVGICWCATSMAADQYTPSDLGTVLTKFGAIKAGNDAGTIPAYTGGLKTSDPAYKEKPFPFASEKPRLVITHSNWKKYKDKISEGQQLLLERYKNYKMKIYPTHRTMSYPKWVLENTVRNAKNPACKIESNGLGLAQACRGGLPFPLVQTGKQVLWNHLLGYQGIAQKMTPIAWLQTGDSSILSVHSDMWWNYIYYQKSAKNKQFTRRVLAKIFGPPRQKGQGVLQWFYMSPETLGGNMKQTWLYTPGLRRVRLSPNASHDTPVSGSGGNFSYGEQHMFNGQMDRFNFTLVKRKELFIPYNNYKATYHCDQKRIMTPNFLNPDCQRWELHRVWVVNAPLKSDKHSVYARKKFYLDEDAYMGGVYEAWDHNGNIKRVGTQQTVTFPEHHLQSSVANVFINTSKRGYYYIKTSLPTYKETSENFKDKPFSPDLYKPNHLRGSGYY